MELYVSNLEKSVRFWEWIFSYLGYRDYQQWNNGRSWIKELTYIVIVQTEGKYLDNKYHRCHPGLNHLAFYVDKKEEVDFLTSSLRDRGVKILYEERHPHAGGQDSYAVYFEDPDRIKVEVVVYSDQI